VANKSFDRNDNPNGEEEAEWEQRMVPSASAFASAFTEEEGRPGDPSHHPPYYGRNNKYNTRY